MSAFVNIPKESYPRDAFDAFNPGLGDVDLGNARALMWFSQLAYETAAKPTLDHVKALWNLSKLTPLVDTQVSPSGSFDTRLIVAERAGCTIVAFAGTDPFVWQNLFTDGAFLKTARGTHEGFQGALDHVWDRFFPLIRNSPRPLVFTGHSLGAALTVLAAERAFDESGKPGGDATLAPVLVYVYGMPRTGNGAWAGAYDQKLGAKTFRFVHASDIVSRVPNLGFQHVGRMLNCATGKKFTVPPPPLALGANAPSLASGVKAAVAAWIVQVGGGNLFAAVGPGILGWAFRFLPLPIRDHLQDQYWESLTP
jgi:hypothetical protein